MPRITLCMIVRDEEALLGGCLYSVRGIVDDIVVVDTGSVDRTRAIASAAGARIFDFTWCDDFAAARNAALRHSRGQWILQLDADERLAPGSAKGIRAALANATFDCGMLRLHDASRLDARPEEVLSGRARLAEVQLVPRLLRRADDLAYVDPIHENVTPWLRRRGAKVAGIDADIVHLGATKDVIDGKQKLERNLRLLRARVERDPTDVTAYGYLAHDTIRAGAEDDALDIAARGLEQARRDAGAAVSVHRIATALAYLLVRRRRYVEAREVAAFAIERDGPNPDFSFFVAYSLESEALDISDPTTRRGLLERSLAAYSECLGFGAQVFAQSFVVGARGWYGWTRLGTVRLLLGQASGALQGFESALGLRPEELAPRLGKAEATLEAGQPLEALRQVEPLLQNTPDAWTIAAAAAQSLGRVQDAKLFAARASALAPAGFVAIHRRERLRDLVAATRAA
jgi:glycosyltransferase involved in cell wall biosynthesis